MNFLEICGIIFLAVIIINAIIGIVAVRSAVSNDKDVSFLYSSSKLN